MSEEKHKTLFLVVDGTATKPPATPDSEVQVLNERTAREALKKIFAADSVAVWTDLAS